MPQCATCSGKGFKEQQLNWKSPLIRIRCKRCRGTGYITRMKTMTPLQRKQLANILLKEGEEGWSIQRQRLGTNQPWETIPDCHVIDCCAFRYRAVRIKRTPIRTPLPIERYKRGMEIANGPCICLVAENSGSNTVRVLYPDETLEDLLISVITLWRWPNETEWKPAFTETVEESVVETLIVEGL